MDNLIFLCLAITSFFSFYLFLNYILNKRSSICRIKKYIGVQETERKKDAKRDFKVGLSIIGNSIGKFSVFDKYKNKIQKELIMAHILLKGEEFITISAICFLIFTIIFMIVFQKIFLGIPFGILGCIIPSFIVKRKKKKRIKVLNDQLGDAIVLISNSLKAGYSFFQSIDMVSKEMQPPISEEFLHLQKEINLGYTMELALENMSNRIDSDDLSLVIIAVLIQRQVGGNLAEVLDNIAGTIRDRVKIKGEIKTLTAQGRISGAIIALVPVALGLVLEFTSPEYIGLLFINPTGWAILGGAVFMQAIGIYSINKIIKIEV